MSNYTPPAGNAVNFNFTRAYTPPAGNTVAFNFSNGNILNLDPGVYSINGTAPAMRYGRRLNVWNELVTNGFFDVDTSGWTVSGDPGVTFAAVNGSGTLTVPPGDVGYAYQAISVTPGYTYQLDVNFGPGLNAMGALDVGIRAGGVEIGAVTSQYGNHQTLSFVATTSTVYLSLHEFNLVFTAGNSLLTKAASLNTISLQQTGNYIITGPDITMHKGYTMNMPGGVYTVTGSSISLRVARQMSASAGVYNLTGTNIALRFGHRIALAAGTYSLAGTAITLKAQRYLATSGTYALTGTNFLLLRKYVIPITPGAYALAGNITLRWGHRLSPAPGVYSIAGSPPVLTYHEVTKVSPDPGIYTVAFSAGSFVYNRAIKVPAGSYLIQGRASTLTATRTLSLTPGVYATAGNDIGMVVDHVTMAFNLGVYSLRMATAQMTVARKMSVAAGAYSIVGQNISLKVSRYLQTSGSYALTGTNFGVFAGRRLAPAAGVYAISGTPISTLRLYKISIPVGAYALTGTSFSLEVTRQLSVSSHSFLLNWSAETLTYVRLQGGPRVLSATITASRYLAVDPQTRYAAVLPQSRYVAAPPQESRYAAVYPVDSRDYAVPPLDRVA